eukprot:6489090-Amphidinium_carterae.1
MGQVLSMVQQLGIVASIRVEWDNPLSALLDFVVSISFVDVELLRPGCMVSMNPVRSYGMRVLAVYVALLLVIAAHFFSTAVQHRRGRSRLHWYVLMCALGTIIMAFFVSIITTMLGPLQCKQHPNSSRTIAWYPSVLCWDDDRHIHMMVIGIAACTLPALFLAGASWAAYSFPIALKKGSPRFLTGWAFLFFRYHAAAYWYGPIQLTRNALISFAPVLPSAASQTLFLETVMLTSLLIVARVMPWRAHFANYLEVLMHCVFLSLMLIACLFIEETPSSEVAVFATVLILVMPFVVIVLIVIGLIKLLQSKGKPYQCLQPIIEDALASDTRCRGARDIESKLKKAKGRRGLTARSETTFSTDTAFGGRERVKVWGVEYFIVCIARSRTLSASWPSTLRISSQGLGAWARSPQPIAQKWKFRWPIIQKTQSNRLGTVMELGPRAVS